MSAILEFCEVTKRYRDGLRPLAVLDRVSFELYEGETIGVLATRRAGKTTLLRLAAGLDTPDEGEVRWCGRPLSKLGPDQRAHARRHGGIGLVCGDSQVRDGRLAIEHVAMPLYSEGLTIARAEDCARRALQTMDASELAYVSIARLGLGERLRVELARAIAREPGLLLVDEPAVITKPHEAGEMYALLHALPERVGCALMVASEEVAALRGAGRIRIMSLDGGRLYSADRRRKVISLSERRGGGIGGVGAGGS
jgi:predicted ABC-type transport system involved in lysophospholipase L1 biosynthesis ATPase subunit